MVKKQTAIQPASKVSAPIRQIINSPDPKDIIEGFAGIIGRRLESFEAVAFSEFIRTKDLGKASSLAGISESRLALMINEPWWRLASVMYLKVYQEVVAHRSLSELNDLMDTLSQGALGNIDAKLYRVAVDHLKAILEIGKDEMKPLKTTKHEVDIKHEITKKEIKITIDMMADWTPEELMEYTLTTKIPERITLKKEDTDE